LHIVADQAVRADENIDLLGGQLFDDLILFFGAAEAAEHLHGNRKHAEALAEGIEVLLGKHRGWHQDGYLLAIVYGLESRAQGNLGLAKTHIPAEQPVHRTV